MQHHSYEKDFGKYYMIYYYVELRLAAFRLFWLQYGAKKGEILKEGFQKGTSFLTGMAFYTCCIAQNSKMKFGKILEN